MTTHDASLNESIMTRDASLIEALRAQIELLKDQVSQEREHSAHWRNQATMLLTHDKQEPISSTNQSVQLWLNKLKRKPNA